jgi:hypothetical protein
MALQPGYGGFVTRFTNLDVLTSCWVIPTSAHEKALLSDKLRGLLSTNNVAFEIDPKQ